MRRAAAVAVLASALALWFLAPRPAVVEPPRPAEDLAAAMDPAVAALMNDAIAAVAASPRAPLAWMKLGMVYEANALFPLAETCYRQALVLEDGSPQCWYHLALVQAHLGDLDAAVASMTGSARLAGDYAPAHWRIGFWKLDQGRLDEAAGWFERALAADPESDAAAVGLARVALIRGDADAAARRLEPLVAAGGPNADYAGLLLAETRRLTGQARELTGQARVQVRQPVWIDPWEAETRWFRPAFGSRLAAGVRLLERGQFDDAIRLLESLRARRPDDLTTLVNLGVAYRGAGRPGDARSVLEAAAAAHPDHFAPHLNLARVCAGGGDLEAALDHANRAVELNRHLAAAHETRGVVLAALDRPDEARAALDTCLSLHPDRPSAVKLRKTLR